jgi:hypothetical protein
MAVGTFGQQVQGSTHDGYWTPNWKKVDGPYLMLESGTVTKLSFLGGGGTNDQPGKGLIYSNVSSLPSVKLGEGTEVVVTAGLANGIIDLPFSPGIHLTAGLYWLGQISGTGPPNETSSTKMWYSTTGTIHNRRNTDTYSDGATDPYGASDFDAAETTLWASYTPDVVDLTPPVVAITSPTGGAILSGVVTVNVTATDNVNVKTVDLKADGAIIQTVIATLGQTTFSFQVDTRVFVNNRLVNLQASATDAQGNAATTTSTQVTVNNNSVYIPELFGDKINEYRLSKEKFGSAVKIIEYDRFGLNPLDYGAVPDGEVNPADGSVVGTDNTVAFQAVVNEARKRGGLPVLLPHAGLSKFKQSDGGPLNRGWLVSTGNISIPHGVSFIGPQGRNGAAQSGDTAGGWCTGVANLVPPSAQPTILCTNTTNPAFKSGGTGGTIANLNFLWPSQVNSSKEWSAGVGADVTALIVYPPGIKITHSDWTLENLTDYNSYIFIDWSCPTKGRIYDIASASHKSVIASSAGANEWKIDGIEFNDSTIYNGHTGWGLGPLLDINNGGPSFLSNVAINRGWIGNPPGASIQIRSSSFGLDIDHVWIDTDSGTDAGILLLQTTVGGGNALGQVVLSNVMVSRGSLMPYALRVAYPDGNLGGGANQCIFKYTNCDFWAPVKLSGGGQHLFANSLCQNGVDLNGSVVGGAALGQRVMFSNCAMGGSSALRSRGGKNFVQMSNIGANQLSQPIWCDRSAQTMAGPITITIASPGVVSFTGVYAISVGDPVVFGTSGALPTGLTVGTTYYVSEIVTANSFKVATSVVNAYSGTHVNTSGSQSGTHTLNTVPGALRVANLDAMKTRHIYIPASTVLATGETVIERFVTFNNWNSTGPRAYEFTVMEALGWGAQNDSWKIEHAVGGHETAILCTLDKGSLGWVGSTTYQGWQRSATDGSGWFSSMDNPIFTFDETTPHPYEIRYVNNTGSPITVPAAGFGLILTYCCM